MATPFALMAIALLAPAIGAAQPEGPTAIDASGVLFVIENQGDAAEFDVELVDLDSGAVTYRGAARVGARTIAEHLAPAPEARYQAWVSALGTGDVGASAGHDLDSRGCGGGFAIAFAASESATGGSAMTLPEPYGCRVLPIEGLAMLEEAHNSFAGVSPGPRIEIPLPNDADAGAFLRWSSLAASGREEADRLEFAWQPASTMRDAGGREVDVARVLVDAGVDHTCSTGISVDGVGSTGNAVSEPITPWIAFAKGSDRPVASMRPGCDAILFADNYGARDYAHGYQTVFFTDAPAEACLLRHGLQGRALSPGDDVSALVACEAWPAARWVAGAAREERGFLAIPVYGTREDADGLFVARVVFANGHPYPLEARAYALPALGTASHEAHELVALAPQGRPVPNEPAPLPPASAPQLAPLDARYGPASEGLPFPLALAVDAALADPTITPLAPFRADPYLAAAMMRARELPARSTFEWHLLFANDEGAVGRATCEQLVAAPTPVVRCREAHPTEIAFLIGEPPEGNTRASLPSAGMSFTRAIEGWRAMDPGAAERAVTYANYRSWSGGFVEVGDARPDPVVPVDADGGASYSFSRFDLVTGRGLRAVSVREDTGIVVGMADGIAALAPSTAVGPDPARAIPGAALVGAGALALLVVLAVLFLLAKGAIGAFFTRLIRPQVLDAEVRSKIHALVQERPGIHASEIIQTFGRGTGLIEYHLDVLVREGFLVSLKSSGFRHYFPSGRHSPQQMRMLAALRVGQAEKLYRIIACEPGIGMSTLVERSGLSQGYVSKEIKRLSRAGLVDATRSGRSVELRAAASHDN